MTEEELEAVVNLEGYRLAAVHIRHTNEYIGIIFRDPHEFFCSACHEDRTEMIKKLTERWVGNDKRRI